MKGRTLRSLGALSIAAILLAAAPALADRPGYGSRDGPPPGYVLDGRYHHDRHYPAHGYVYPRLPRHYHTAYYGHDRYYYGGGVWYQPYGPRFTVIAPPVGVSVSFLPEFYTTVWFGGVPYYYANSVYYARRPYGPGYVVTEAPEGTPERIEPPAAAAAEDFYMYPREGQGEEVQGRDRYECHRWAVSQTGFDPTESEGGVPESQNAARRSDYLRAITACLDARGYTVR